MKKHFAFIYPLTLKKVDLERPGGFRYDHVADLVIDGLASIVRTSSRNDLPEDRYEFDLNRVEYEGKNILPLLEAFDVVDQVEAACFHHIHHLFSGLESDYQTYYRIGDSWSGKVISLPLKRKIK